MTFDEYSEQAASTAIYPGVGKMSEVGINYCLVGLAGETGELLNKWKKILRGDRSITDETRAQLASELGGVLWYLSAAANELSFSLDDVAQRNLNVLRSRRERGVLQGDGDER